MAGDYVENRELESTATSVAKACGGLPIALTTVAKALRKKELPVWKNALQELQTPSEASFDEGVPAEAYSTIELSYKYLRGEQLKKTFLLCSLITPAPIMDLFKYSMGLGVFKSVHNVTGREVSSPCGTPASHTTRVSLEEVAQCRLVSPCLGLVRRTASVPNQCASGFS